MTLAICPWGVRNLACSQFPETADNKLNNVTWLLLGTIGLVLAIVDLLRSTLFAIHGAVPNSIIGTVRCGGSTQSTTFTQPAMAIPPSSSMSGGLSTDFSTGRRNIYMAL